MIAGPLGAGVGYVAGSVIGGITGSLSAQRIEGREEYSWGRTTADTLLNILPGFKPIKGAKLLPKLIKRSAIGVGVAGSANVAEQVIDDGSISMKELLGAASVGAIFNIGIGAVGDSLSKKYSAKFSGKSTDEMGTQRIKVTDLLIQ